MSPILMALLTQHNVPPEFTRRDLAHFGSSLVRIDSWFKNQQAIGINENMEVETYKMRL